MADLKASPLDRLYLVGAIHRMGERTGAAAERILDDLDTLRAEVERLRAALREMLRAFDGAHELDCNASGAPDTDVCRCENVCPEPHCECGATDARNAALAALGEP